MPGRWRWCLVNCRWGAVLERVCTLGSGTVGMCTLRGVDGGIDPWERVCTLGGVAVGICTLGRVVVGIGTDDGVVVDTPGGGAGGCISGGCTGICTLGGWTGIGTLGGFGVGCGWSIAGGGGAAALPRSFAMWTKALVVPSP